MEKLPYNSDSIIDKIGE